MLPENLANLDEELLELLTVYRMEFEEYDFTVNLIERSDIQDTYGTDFLNLVIEIKSPVLTEPLHILLDNEFGVYYDAHEYMLEEIPYPSLLWKFMFLEVTYTR